MNKGKHWQIFLKMGMTLLLGTALSQASAQTANLPFGSPIYNLLERGEMKSGSLKNDVFLDALPLSRFSISYFPFYLYQKDLNSHVYYPKDSTTKADSYWIKYHREDNLHLEYDGMPLSSRPILKHFYRTPANLYQASLDSSFFLVVNPVLGLTAGYTNVDGLRYRNTRGAEIRGTIDRKIGFYTYLTDNQVLFPDYVNRYSASLSHTAQQVLTGEGYVKPYKKDGYDYFTTRAYITFSPTRHIHVQFGNDQNKIGTGIRSLLLSETAKDYTNLKITTRVWRIQYQNIFAEFIDGSRLNLKPYPKKYGAFHYLSVDAAKWLNFGLFEGIIFYDRLNTGRRFEFSYLNPVIFYRSAEQQLGSTGDNSLVGANFNILPVRKLKLYGQVMLDEFRVGEVFKNNRGWRGNKYGLQAGLKWIDIFGLPNVDLQLEANHIRPYTYSYDTVPGSYTHYNQPLAHPLGGNLQEGILRLNINPWGPLMTRVSMFYIRQGRDSLNGGPSFGGNLLRNNQPPWQEYQNKTGQGVLTTTLLGEVLVSYQARHNLFLDLTALYRRERSAQGNYNTMYIGAGLRLNFNYPNYYF